MRLKRRRGGGRGRGREVSLLEGDGKVIGEDDPFPVFDGPGNVFSGPSETAGTDVGREGLALDGRQRDELFYEKRRRREDRTRRRRRRGARPHSACCHRHGPVFFLDVLNGAMDDVELLCYPPVRPTAFYL